MRMIALLLEEIPMKIEDMGEVIALAMLVVEPSTDEVLLLQTSRDR
jgi:hypothetical protein